IIELCRYCPGMVTAMGVSVGLAAAAVMSKGTLAQKRRWGEALMTLEKIGAWAITEPGSGSDAFGSMKATARRDGDVYVLNGNKTVITNRTDAHTILFTFNLEDGTPHLRHRYGGSCLLASGWAGLLQCKQLSQ